MRFPHKAKDFKTTQKNFDFLQRLGTHITLYRVAAQSIANNSFTTTQDISWDTVGDANSTMWGAGTAVKITAAGVWAIDVTTRWASSANAGYRIAAIFINGAEPTDSSGRSQFNHTTGANNDVTCNVSRKMRLKAGDLITVRVFQTSGAALNLDAASLDVTLIAP